MKYFISLAVAASVAVSGVQAHDRGFHSPTSAPSDKSDATPPPPAEDAVDSTQCYSIAAVAEASGLTSLLELASQLGDSEEAQALFNALTATERSPAAERITVFAPINPAFNEILDVDALPTPLEILLNHVVLQDVEADAALQAVAAADGGVAMVPSLTGELDVTTSTGDDVIVSPSGSSIMATVLVPDVETCVGPVHVIDRVLLPSVTVTPNGEVEEPMEMEDSMEEAEEAPMVITAMDAAPVRPRPSTAAPAPAGMTDALAPESVECMSVLDVATIGNLSILLSAMEAVAPRSDDVNTLLNISMIAGTPFPPEERITIFAPTNAAFEQIASAQGLPRLDYILLNHVILADLQLDDVLGAVNASSPDPALVPTLLGNLLEVSVDGSDVFVTPEGTTRRAEIIATDLDTCIGTVHVVDMVLVPGGVPSEADAPASSGPSSTGSSGGYGGYGGEEDMPVTMADVPMLISPNSAA